ncbi:MAG: hypothetical protein Q4B79_03700 [Moraxella sp.]|uniref:hypothetical protein n=1 Tax=Moraxella sp. TaxID=479 RepID=UPI0026DD954D|nr:hypothetical protein [Moraxella sp.]MDO4450048.1 hypothetical protein [Moraxella sp.]
MFKNSPIPTLTKQSICQDFMAINEQIKNDGKTLLAFYVQFVDDYYAVANFAITKEDFANCNDNQSILDAVWSGRCELYDSPLDGVGLHQAVSSMTMGVDDYEIYNQIRHEFEICVINTLKECDKDGIFGNRKENGILLFAYYADDYDGSGTGSLLDRSANALNPSERIKEIFHWCEV